MKSDPILQKAILDVVHNQLKNNDLPETKQTYNRLIKEGFSESEVEHLIGCVVSAEIFDILKKNNPLIIEDLWGH